MVRFIKSRKKSHGTTPGSLIFIGNQKMEKPEIYLMVYGTNFDYLPELHFKYAYFVMLGFMAIVAAGMLYFFRKKKWL